MERLTKTGINIGFIDSNTLPNYETVYERLRKYEDLEEKCIQKNTWCLETLLKKWKDGSRKEVCKMKGISLNGHIKAKLTPQGAEIFYHQFDNTNKKIEERGGKPIEPKMPRIDKDGYTDFVLWDFIKLYGEHIGINKQNVVIDSMLYIPESELEDI